MFGYRGIASPRVLLVLRVQETCKGQEILLVLSQDGK